MPRPPKKCRKKERKREREILAQGECSRSCRSHPPRGQEGGFPSPSLSFFLFLHESGRSQPGGVPPQQSRSASAISGDFHTGILARLEPGARDSDIGAVGSPGDRRPTTRTFGSLPPTTSLQSANLQGGYHTEPTRDSRYLDRGTTSTT